MNWGWRIAIGYSVFVVMMLVLVVMAFRQTNDLVTEDYYGEELRYQEVIDARRNSKALADPVTFDETGGVLTIQFPSDLSPKGELQLYRPSDKSADRFMAIQTDEEGLMSVPLEGMVSGFWRVNLNWMSGETTYFNESTLMVP